ncbi:gamma-glutamyltransferase family protein [Mesorhizobium sp. J428]|uniref:gamma-glutamyltransferase family protein n=1 Tax=Mesorhizobium sp. J428 TaxID=2898440 RepID=UPI0021517094|nr:gamma-glutamyltransferase family protein [Mesorhizobium sp. J428]MCR5856982.1 gamma-glutamyltransferase family protein [Mesorhizobium sp. J428]
MNAIPHSGFLTRPQIEGTFGVVASTHWIPSAVAMGILERDGNAFDAAAAAGFTLQMVEPHLNGPAGEVPIMVYDRRKNRPEVICGQGVAPDAATIERFESMGLDLVPGTGLMAACVPGSFDAWMLLLRDYGTMSLRDILEPAIHYARKGVPVIPRIESSVASMRPVFEKYWPGSAAVYIPGGNAPRRGGLHTNARAADTYERILGEAEAAGGNRERQIEAARNAWYRGFVAEAIDNFCRKGDVLDAEGNPHRGLLTGDDMARWSAAIEQPVSTTFRNFEIFKPGFWSQGPVMLQQLALLEGFQLETLGPNSAEFVHTVVECSKLAFADREAFYGDPDFVDVPAELLLSRSYAEERRKLVGDAASAELLSGRMGDTDWQRHLEALGRRKEMAGAGAGEPTVAGTGEPTVADVVAERGDTVHIDVIDRHGNMVAATPSGGWLQSSPLIPSLGFPLGTRAQMFWLERGLPSSLAPRKRPRTTLSSSIAFRDGEPYMVWGTPGGDQQDQWSLQIFLRHAVFGLNLQEAIEQPGWHSEHFPASFWPRAARPKVLVVEGRFPAHTIAELRKRGHEVEIGADWSEGRLCAASRTGTILRAGADPRSTQGYALGR